MPGLKTQLGLGEPAPAGSNAQRDQFKAAFQAAMSKINAYLQYTAAHADNETHNPQSVKRDNSCSAFQMTLPKIDPTNESAAKGAIDQVLKAVSGLESSLKSVRDAVQKAFDAWTARESDFDQAVDKIREMVEWGHDKAGALQSVVEAIAQKANARKYEESLQGLIGMLDKLAPIHEDYLKQLAAQQEYDAALPALKEKLQEASVCQFQSLADLQQELVSREDAMTQAAEAKDYVSAMDQLRVLRDQADHFLTRLHELEAQKEAYEQAREQLAPRLAEASTCQYGVLAPLDDKIVDLDSQAESLAAEEQYEAATQLLTELTAVVEEKILKAAELDAKREQYEQVKADVYAVVDEAATSEFASLAELDEQILSLKDQSEQAASAEDYDAALELLGQLAPLAEQKLQKAEELRAKRDQYEQARASVDGDLAECSTSEYKSLAELDEQILQLQNETDAAAEAEAYDEAITLVEQLGQKVAEKQARIAELEAQKAAYEAARKEAEAAYEKCFFLAYSYKTLKADQAALKPKLQAVDAAAASEDYEQALSLAGELKAACDAYLAKGEEEQKKYDKKGEDITKELDDADELNREDIAKRIAKELKPDEIKHMPIEVRNRLMQEIERDGFTDDDKAAMRELYKVRTLDPEFEEAERVKREELIKRLKEDPELSEARKNWGEMDKDAKLDVMRKVAGLHSEVYGTKDVDPPMTVEPSYKEPNYDRDGKVESWNNGTYNHRTGKLTVNTHEYEGVKFNNFDRALDLAVHESGHRYQSVLADKVESGDLTEDDPEYNQAVAFRINDSRYGYYARSKESNVAYRNQPREAHSRESGGEIQNSGIGHHDHDHDEDHEH